MTQPPQLNFRPCPLCGASGRTLLFVRDGWDFAQCAACRLVFLGHALSYEAQQAGHDWAPEYHREGERRRQEQPLMVLLSRLSRPIKPETNARLLAKTLHWAPSGRLVDFGCGSGAFLARAREKFDVLGIEMSPGSVALARQRIPPAKILQGPLTEVAGTLPERTFDVVTQFGYLEHEWHPREALAAAFRILKPGGVTIVKSPNFDSWNRHIRGLAWCGYHVPAHCNYFTPRTLARLLRESGFQPLPRRLADRLPTSDSLWMAARRPLS